MAFVVSFDVVLCVSDEPRIIMLELNFGIEDVFNRSFKPELRTYRLPEGQIQIGPGYLIDVRELFGTNF